MTTREFETIRLDIADGIATITLHRPDKLNAFNVAMTHELIAAFDVTDADDNVKAVIVTGAGERAFCAGLELAPGDDPFDFRDSSPGAVVDGVQRDIGGRVVLRIFESLKPVIAAINGAAIGVGATLQLAMDIRLASTKARYSFLFAKRGITPEACSSWFLPRIVGIQTALDWCYSGRMISAEEALERGLVYRLHEPDDLMPAAIALAQEIARNAAPVSIALTRQMMWRMLGADHPMEAHKLDSRAVQARSASTDAREGVESFLEKRAAEYRNRVSADMPDFFPWWQPRHFS